MTTNAVLTNPVSEPPTLHGLPLLGNLIQFRKSRGLPVEFLTNALNKFGDLIQVKVLNRSIYVAGSPDLTHEILVKRVNEFHKAEALSTKPILLGRFLGQGILTAGHEAWRPQRKLIQPLMHTKHIKSYAETMAHFGEQLLKDWYDGAVRDIHADMTQVTMWIIAETMFGMNVNQSPEIQESVNAAQDITVQDILSPLPDWLTIQRDRRAAAVNETLTAVVHRFMAERRAQPESNRYDLLSLLMETRDEDGQPMSEEFVRDNILTLFLAGHETTANTLTWVFYYLDKHPEVAEKLWQEVDTVLAGRLPTLDDLPQLPYTLMVIKETMRIQPTVSMIPRSILEDTTLAGYRLKAGSVIFVSLYSLHHDKRWWTNPEAFDPTRFSAENEANIPKYAYLPFGGGPRVCIGNHFALMEAQILLAVIASQYRLSLVEGAKVESLRQITTFPQNGLPMRMEKR